MKYWINVVSRDHVQCGVAGGFTQANHGKPWALRKMRRGDWLVFYSPKTAFADGEPLQAFTAAGQIADDEVYYADMSPDFRPARRAVDFSTCQEAPIHPLIDELEFITDKAHWGYRFRLGVIEISQKDFESIAAAMKLHFSSGDTT